MSEKSDFVQNETADQSHEDLLGKEQLAELLSIKQKAFFVDPSEVYAKKQVRIEFGDLSDLAKSIRNNKQKQPCVVFPKDQTGKYPLYVGERRWRACQEIAHPLWVVLEDDVPTDHDIQLGQLAENLDRESLSPLEIGRGIHQLMAQFNYTQKSVAERLGVSEKFVSINLGCRKLPQCVQDACLASDITDADTLITLRRLFDIDPERCEKMCARAHDERVTREGAQEALRDAKGTSDKVEAEQNKEGPATVGNVEQEADREYQQELKESGLDEAPLQAEGDEAVECRPDGEVDLEDPESDASCKQPDINSDTSRYPTPAGDNEEDGLAGLVTKEGWIERDPRHARLLVKTEVDGEVRAASLCIDRYDPDDSMVWVSVGVDKNTRYVRVPAESVTLKRISN